MAQHAWGQHIAADRSSEVLLLLLKALWLLLAWKLLLLMLRTITSVGIEPMGLLLLLDWLLLMLLELCFKESQNIFKVK